MFVKRHTRRSALGQAAVEAMFTIPVMMLVFAIGTHLFNMTYNAQYAHIKARSKIMKNANHMPCRIGDGRGVQELSQVTNGLRDQASATTSARNITGIVKMTQPARTMKAKAELKCE
jgi:hypothetical protein